MEENFANNTTLFDFIDKTMEGAVEPFFERATSIKKSIRQGLLLVNDQRASINQNLQPGDIVKYAVRAKSEYQRYR